MLRSDDHGCGIDLNGGSGDVGDLIELDLSVPWEVGQRPAVRGRLRRLAVVGVLLLVAALLGTDAQPPWQRQLFQLSTSARQVVVDPAGLLYVLADNSIAAHRLPDGQRLWHQPDGLPHPADGARTPVLVTMHAGGEGTLLVNELDLRDGAVRTRLRALDSATGQELWSRPGVTGAGFAGASVVGAGGEVATGAGTGPVAERTYTGFDVRTGATVWSAVLPATSDWATAAPGVVRRWNDQLNILSGPRRMILTCAGRQCSASAGTDGVVSVDPGSGAVLRLQETPSGLGQGEVMIFSAPAGADTTTIADEARLTSGRPAGSLTDGRVLLARPGRRHGTTIVAVDLNTGRSTTLLTSRVSLGAAECRGAGRYLACASGATVRVWRIG